MLGEESDADKIIQAVNNAFKPEERQRSESQLTEEEVDYLVLPIKALHYLEKYKKTEDQLAHACAMKKIKWVMHDGVLWVSDEPFGWQGEGVFALSSCRVLIGFPVGLGRGRRGNGAGWIAAHQGGNA